ncbi:DNA-binding IclR family transcriptional regulator [Azospirillum agricola]|uniref:IclR family transcriptional regulator n=1 Tax=Azospirillum agricola TaxID=1720247 RepID=UPI001AE9471D|nr:IclR family transcriptional regulator [Azospirillum agricola]MBP2231913.1 DNA-binding IclR family transcriptional regulator [Azospirillum agricola]
MPKTTDDEPKDRQFVTALSRGLEILRCFSLNRRELTTVEIAQLTGLPQPSVWRLCYTLIECGYLVSNPASKKLSVGPAVLMLGYSAVSRAGFADAVNPYLQRIAERFGGAASIAIRERDAILLLQRWQADTMLTLNLSAGSTVSLSRSAIGWGYLAGLPSQERRRLLADLKVEAQEGGAELLADIERAMADYARDGFVVNCGKSQKIINGVALPLSVRQSRDVYLLGCSGAATDFTEARIRAEAGPMLREIAGELSLLIGDLNAMAAQGTARRS